MQTRLRAVDGSAPDGFTVIASWRKWLQAQGLSPSTIRLYSYGVFRLLTEHVEGPLWEATEDHVTEFLRSMGGRSGARVQYARAMRSLFKYALARGLVAVDPTAEIRLRKPRRAPPVALTEEELARYLIAAAWRNPRRAWTLMLVYSIGARRMEAAEIRPEDVQGGVVHLRRCKYGKERRVELGPLARAALEGLRPWYGETVLGDIAKTTISEWAHDAAVDSGLEAKVRRRPAHVLRASFITYLLRRGVPVQVVRDLVGHSNIAITNEYAAVEPEERREAVELV